MGLELSLPFVSVRSNEKDNRAAEARNNLIREQVGIMVRVMRTEAQYLSGHKVEQEDMEWWVDRFSKRENGTTNRAAFERAMKKKYPEVK